MSAISSGSYSWNSGFDPTCASGDDVHHQCRSCPPEPHAVSYTHLTLPTIYSV